MNYLKYIWSGHHNLQLHVNYKTNVSKNQEYTKESQLNSNIKLQKLYFQLDLTA